MWPKPPAGEHHGEQEQQTDEKSAQTKGCDASSCLSLFHD
jgi:hypothetical protein